MARGRKCYVICNTTYGYCSAPIECNSIREAEEKAAHWWSYRIFDAVTKNIIKRGYGSQF